MSKLKSAVLYEYLTKVKAIGIFYLIQYLIVALIFTIVAICTKGNETGSNTLEFSSVVFCQCYRRIRLQRRFQGVAPKWIYPKIYFWGDCLYVYIAGGYNGTY